MQVLQYALTLQASRLHNGQNPLDEAAPRFAPTTKAALSPQYRTAQQPFHEVIGGFHAFDHHKCPQGHFQLGEIGAESPDGLVLAGLPSFQQSAHLSDDRPQAFFQLFPRALAFLEGMPRGKNPFHNQQSLPAQLHARSTAVNKLLKIAFELDFCPF